MTPRLKWIVLVGAVLIACAYTVRRVYYPRWFPVNAAEPSANPMTDADLAIRIRLPPGFTIHTFASGLPSARMLRFTTAGDLLVSAPSSGKCSESLLIGTT